MNFSFLFQFSFGLFFFVSTSVALAQFSEAQVRKAQSHQTQPQLTEIDFRSVDLSVVENRYFSFERNDQQELQKTKCNRNDQTLLACVHGVNVMLSSSGRNAVLLPVEAAIRELNDVSELKRFSDFKLIKASNVADHLRSVFKIWRDHFKANSIDEKNQPPLDQVFDWIRGQETDSVQQLELAKQAVNGYLQILFRDHARVQPWFEILENMNKTKESLVGYGFAFKNRNNHPTVYKVLPGSPADRSGLMVNDVILKTDHRNLVGLSKNQIEEYFSSLGSDGDSTVQLTVVRNGEPVIAPLTLKKEPIEFDNVSAETLLAGSRKLGLISIHSFYRGNACSEVKDKIEELKRESVEGWVVDVRNNGGGLVEQGVCVADLFLQKGLLVTETRPVIANIGVKKYFSTSEPITDLPMVVLVDESTGSASEFFAGALADHRRALLVGNRTAGKGTVQTSFRSPFNKLINEPGNQRIPFWDVQDMILFVTTSRFYQPSGSSNQLKGIVPHIKVFRSPKYRDEGSVFREIDFAVNPVPADFVSSRRSLSEGFLDCLRKGVSRSQFADAAVSHSYDFQILKAKDALLCQALEIKTASR